MKKIYVLDTNILMQTNGQAILGFEDNDVVITHTTLEELDGLKNAPGEKGYSARESIRIINNIVENNKNCLNKISLPTGGTFRIETNSMTAPMPEGWKLDKPDNRIICTAKTLSVNERKVFSVGGKEECKVILITNDVAMRIKAIAAGVETQGYFNESVTIDKFYTGRGELFVEPADIAEIYREGFIDADDFNCEFNENEFVLLINNLNTSNTALAWNRKGKLQLINQKDDFNVYGITPKNIGQRFALAALMEPVSEIPLVILKGPAGCGKTLLSMAAGMNGTYDCKKGSLYDSMLITRANVLADEEIGFLPGTLEDKMTPLLAPFFDNLKVLLKQGTDEEPEQIKMQAEELIDTGIVEITSLAYIRGRSISNSMMIIDEAQNLTVSQINTIVTRAGEGTKMVFLGDPDQIDTPKLDKRNNGLVYLSEKMKNSPLCAQVTFTKEKESVRSPLALEAIRLLLSKEDL